MSEAAKTAGTIVATPAPVLTPRREVWLSLKSNRGAMAALILILLLILCAIFAPLLAPHDYAAQNVDIALTPPAWAEGGNSSFLLGTDGIGRDILSRLIYGSQFSLMIGLIVVTLSLTVGVLLGLVSGFHRGTVDTLIMRLMDIILALPSLLLAIVIVVLLGAGLANAMIAVAITNIPHYARLTRAAVMSELTKDYVVASKVAGAGTLRLMFKTVLPNCLAPLIVQSTLGISSAVLDAAALGFLGLGAQPPTPEWGTMLADARQYIDSAWWVVTFPGLAILVTVLAFNLLGDGLRDALDPKLKR
ncbi:ABC transporter permease subunit [Dongia sedimenti]|uniref:ABC transporter permease subunit n=1 Tax=Dongia sedimenti TaxID=3064282 RepID=A0ABU0YI96_9PROT|nr:ABC transporter permease subunit [Rhodospirillaceae bacterium R-7]